MQPTDEARILRDSMRVAIDPILLGVDEAETNPEVRAQQLRDAALLSGVMCHASITLVDKLFEDVGHVHAQSHGQWSDVVDDTHVLSRLPTRFWHQVTPGFANMFSAVAVDLTGRVSRGWTPLVCVAHELALKCLLDEMEVIADNHEVPLPPGWRSDLEQFLFEDLDHEFLYAQEYDGFEDDPGFGPPGNGPDELQGLVQAVQPGAASAAVPGGQRLTCRPAPYVRTDLHGAALDAFQSRSSLAFAVQLPYIREWRSDDDHEHQAAQEGHPVQGTPRGAHRH